MWSKVFSEHSLPDTTFFSFARKKAFNFVHQVLVFNYTIFKLIRLWAFTEKYPGKGQSFGEKMKLSIFHLMVVTLRFQTVVIRWSVG